MSRYIMQEDLTQKFLTVIEAMKYSISLKLGHTVEDKLKQDVVSFKISPHQTVVFQTGILYKQIHHSC